MNRPGRAITIPPEFAYLADAATMCANLATVDEHQAFLEGLTSDGLAVFASAQREIAKRGDAQRIADWLGTAPARPSDRNARWAVLQMLFVFQALAERDVEPFCHSEITLPAKPKESLGWEGELKELQYLKEVAERFGKAELIERAALSQSDIDTLTSAAESCRLAGHHHLIESVLQKYPITDWQESAQLYWLLGVMDAPDLDWGG